LASAFIATLALAPAASAAITVSTSPSLFPGFSESITDYVTRCTPGTPVTVNVTAPAGTQVDVDRQGPQTGSFGTSVALGSGQSFTISATGGSTGSWHVRCLPSDYPTWSFSRIAPSQLGWFTAAAFAGNPSFSRNYVGIYDVEGVPMWFSKAGQQPLDFHPVDNGNVVWTNFTAASSEEHQLDGALVRTITAGGAGVAQDTHEALRLANGNYLINTSRNRDGYDFCGLTNKTIADQGYQEVAPGGTVVKEWFPSDFIPLTEIPVSWCNTIVNGPFGGTVYDVYHVNSVEPVGDDFVLSFRHLDAIYRVDGDDGSIVWKLGGVARPGSLTILSDPHFPGTGFGGQHDARVLGDGSVTLFDNGFHPDAALRHPPRGVRYAIDTGAGTATMLEEVYDPSGLPAAGCCGSARKLPGGNWLIAFGSVNQITELTPAGGRVWSMSFSGSFTYRSHPLAPAGLSRAALRNAMDAQYPRPYVRPAGATPLRASLVPAAQACTAPNRAHGTPLAFGSCRPPAAASSQLTVGIPETTGFAPQSSGAVRFGVITGNTSTPANEADVKLTAGITDVRRKPDLTDYAGQLQVRTSVRITDAGGATVSDLDFPAAVPCTPTGATTVGSTCELTSTFNAILPGAVLEGKRAVWELADVKVFDGGTSGVAGASDATLFARQGLFVP
jgi:hypothetical protein